MVQWWISWTNVDIMDIFDKCGYDRYLGQMWIWWISWANVQYMLMDDLSKRAVQWQVCLVHCTVRNMIEELEDDIRLWYNKHEEENAKCVIVYVEIMFWRKMKKVFTQVCYHTMANYWWCMTVVFLLISWNEVKGSKRWKMDKNERPGHCGNGSLKLNWWKRKSER